LSKNAARNRRKTLKEIADVPEKSTKFQESRVRKALHITAKNQNQAIALDFLRSKQMVVLGGTAGAGKTFLACTHAANEYLKGNISQIVLIRPAEPLGKTVGFKKGSQFEKLKPLMQTMLDDLSLVLGTGELDCMLKNEKLILESAEDCRGRSYKRSVVVVDESQNLDIPSMKALLTRVEEDSQIIFCGDWKQKDLKGESGLEWMYRNLDDVRRLRPEYLDTEDMNQALTNIGTVIFTNEDCVRSGLTKFWIKVFDNAR
jgi:phosphate starvation-inducible PhoH-like protein